jgi:hypothetical protein
LCVFSPRSLRDAARIMWRLLRKDFRDDPCVLYRAGASSSSRRSPRAPRRPTASCSGPTPFSVSVDPRAARLLVPRVD